MTTATLGQMVDNTMVRWNREALGFCAMHGSKGGTFNLVRWANGNLMAEVPGSLPNQAIHANQLDELKRNNWKIYS